MVGCLGNPRKLKFRLSFAYFSSSAFSISDTGPDVFTWNVPSSACSRNGCPEEPTFLGCVADFGTCPAWIRRDSPGRITEPIVCEKENTEIPRLLYILMVTWTRTRKKIVIIYLQCSLCFIVFHKCFLCGFAAGLVEDLSSSKPFVSYTIFMWWLYAIEQLCWHNCTYYILCVLLLQCSSP